MSVGNGIGGHGCSGQAMREALIWRTHGAYLSIHPRQDDGMFRDIGANTREGQC